MEEMTVLEQEMEAAMKSAISKKDYHQTKMMDVNTNLTREWHESELAFYELRENKIRNLLNRLDVDNVGFISEEFKKIMDLAR